MLKLFERTRTINDNKLTIVIGKDKDILRNMIYYIPWIEDFNMYNFRKADFVYQRFDKESGYLDAACVYGAIFLKTSKPWDDQINHRYLIRK